MFRALLSLVGLSRKGSDPATGEAVPRRGIGVRYLRLGALLLVVLVLVGIFLLRDRIAWLSLITSLDPQRVREGVDLLQATLGQAAVYVYLGTFLISLMSSATLFFPLPSAVTFFVLGGLLNPVLVGLAAGVGGGLGELTGYLAGYSGQTLLERSKWYGRMKRWMMRWGALFLFIISTVPNPFLDLAGVAAGALRYPVWRFILFCSAGKIVRNVGVALLGYLGLDWGLRLLERVFS